MEIKSLKKWLCLFFLPSIIFAQNYHELFKSYIPQQIKRNIDLQKLFNERRLTPDKFTHETSFESLVQIGRFSLKQLGNFEAASICLKQALQLDQNSLEAHELLAETYYKKYEYKKAAFEYSQCLQLNPKKSGYYNTKCGNLYFYQGNLEVDEAKKKDSYIRNR